MTRAVISDFSGTIFEYPTDKELNSYIGDAILADAKAAFKKGKIWRAADVVKLLRAKRELKKTNHAIRSRQNTGNRDLHTIQ